MPKVTETKEVKKFVTIKVEESVLKRLTAKAHYDQSINGVIKELLDRDDDMSKEIMSFTEEKK